MQIEENNRMGKTGDLFKKIRDTKGTFHVKMSTINDSMVWTLKEAKDVKKRMQGYTEELYKKYLNDADNHVGAITHLYPDILECEVKWASGSIAVNKTSRGDRIPVELFQILKSVALNLPANLENSHGHRTGKGQFSLQSQRKSMPKNAQTTAQIHSSHMLVK